MVKVSIHVSIVKNRWANNTNPLTVAVILGNVSVPWIFDDTQNLCPNENMKWILNHFLDLFDQLITTFTVLFSKILTFISKYGYINSRLIFLSFFPSFYSSFAILVHLLTKPSNVSSQAVRNTLSSRGHFHVSVRAAYCWSLSTSLWEPEGTSPWTRIGQCQSSMRQRVQLSVV